MGSTQHTAEKDPVRTVPAGRPLVWLREGWADLMHHRAASLAYGVLVSALGLLVLIYTRHPVFVAVAWVTFLLIGPIMAAGCCELSRRQDRGESATFQESLRPLSRNRSALLGVATTLALIALAWFTLSAGLFQSIVGDVAPSVTSTVWGGVMEQLTVPQLLAYVAVGAVLCAAVFALSVVTIPAIIDRDAGALSAMRLSVRVALRDLPAMLVWAVLIALLVLLGFATSLIAMLFVFPLLSHATWRAYRELVQPG